MNAEFADPISLPGSQCDTQETVETRAGPGSNCEPLLNKELEEWEDCGKWSFPLPQGQRLFIVANGPVRVTNDNDNQFPANKAGRRFSTYHYNRCMSNGETLNRRWLVYSTSTDRVYCFCCKLFAKPNNRFAHEGCSDWRHLSKLLNAHETSKNHMMAYLSWTDTEVRLTKNEFVDKELQQEIELEKSHWRAVLERLLAIVHFLASRNLAFRGSSDRLSDSHNGNFLGLVELFAKFEPVLKEHVRRIKSAEIADHYLGKSMQNEFIQIISNEVLQTIVRKIKRAQYFSVILDCTPDISHQEQMTLVLRCVDINEKLVNVVEHFVGFIVVDESTGVELTEVFLAELRKLGLLISDCRGQGYDNGANMSGRKKGVQARIQKLESRAFYMPCGCHSLNLVLGDMAKSCTAAMVFFGTIQQIYVLFSASTQRWQLLKQHVPSLTVKPLCETRWESRVESVKPLRYQLGAIYDAIVEVSESANDPKCRSEAAGLAKNLKDFKFLVTLVVWYELLSHVNVASKMLQSCNSELDAAVSILEKTLEFVKRFKENGLTGAVIDAKELAAELQMTADEMTFKQECSLRRRKVKRQFSYEAFDETVENPYDKYRIEFFNVIMDQCIMSLSERFSQLQTFQQRFGFLFNIRGLSHSQKGAAGAETADETDEYTELRQKCEQLQSILTKVEHTGEVDDQVLDMHETEVSNEMFDEQPSEICSSDINAINLFDELKNLSTVLPDNVSSPLEVLRYILAMRLHECFPNVSTALRVLLTVPVTVASGERSFSKLKLIKTYLRSTMTQDRLNRLAVLSIENDVAASVDYAHLLSVFASVKARKITI